MQRQIMELSHLTKFGHAHLTALVVLMSLLAPSARAQIQTTGTTGSPSATTTLIGDDNCLSVKPNFDAAREFMLDNGAAKNSASESN